MPEDMVREYQRKYYVEHRGEISQRKRDRYAGDPSVRETARKKAMERYLEGRVPGERKVRKYNHPRVVLVGGKTVLYYCVGEFADGVGRNVQTITQWEDKKVIPAPTMVDRVGRRWYSEVHMDAVADAVEKYDKGGRRSLSVLKQIVGEEFERQVRV